MSISKSLKPLLVSGTVLLGLSVGGIALANQNVNAMSTTNQRSNALTSYINYHDFHFTNNHNYTIPASYSNHYNQNTNPYRHIRAIGGNYKRSFSPYAELSERYSTNPQSVTIDNRGSVYVAYRLGGNKVRIARYKKITTRRGLSLGKAKFGPVFNGGHGQAMSYNPKTDQIWMLTNNHGSASKTSVMEIRKKTLSPMRKTNFKMSPYPVGDVLTFDKYGNAYTATDTYGGVAPHGSIKLYKGRITDHTVKFHMVQGLRHMPGNVMQNMSYNNHNNRIYFIADGELMSVPANKYGNARPSDVRTTKLSGHYEPEDLAFYHGKGYLMLHYPSELLSSNFYK